jgi:uncharacterized protein (DUF1684 family)
LPYLPEAGTASRSNPLSDENPYHGPEAYALADWRQRIGMLYGAVREAPSPAGGWRIWRDGRDDLFRNHPMSPLPQDQRRTFSSIACYNYDGALRFSVDLEMVETPRTIEYDLGADGRTVMKTIARTSGLSGSLGAELTLYWIEGYGGGLFIPFADRTSGTETYGGGRYLVDTIKGADLGLDPDGRLILDFNFAYNPSCSYSPDYVCPLSPAENRLTAAISAGERFD